LTTGGVAAGIPGAASAASQLQALTEAPEPAPEDHQLDWDDIEEQNYRLWVRQQTEGAQNREIDWSELDSEMAYRERLRKQTEANADAPISWDDKDERILRDKYVQMRKKQSRDQPAANWDEQKAEADHRERIRKCTEKSRKKTIVWDDADERKCQERYRKKYSSCN